MNKNLCEVKGCHNFGRYARYCGHLNGALKEPSPIAKQSDGMKEAMREYTKAAGKFKKENPICKANIESICTGKTSDVHHQKGKASKELLLDERWWLPVCRRCHQWIEQNPLPARLQGLSFSRHAKTEKV